MLSFGGGLCSAVKCCPLLYHPYRHSYNQKKVTACLGVCVTMPPKTIWIFAEIHVMSSTCGLLLVFFPLSLLLFSFSGWLPSAALVPSPFPCPGPFPHLICERRWWGWGNVHGCLSEKLRNSRKWVMPSRGQKRPRGKGVRFPLRCRGFGFMWARQEPACRVVIGDWSAFCRKGENSRNEWTAR